MIDRFLEIGFREVKPSNFTIIGLIREYKYFPNYLGENHYTLVTLSQSYALKPNYENYDKIDFRLYVHRNSDGSFVDSVFQIPGEYSSILDGEFKRIFVSELREVKINQIL